MVLGAWSSLVDWTYRLKYLLLCSAALCAQPALAASNANTSAKPNADAAKPADDDQSSPPEIVVTAQRLNAARESIDPSIGATTARFAHTDLEVQPGGIDRGLKNVLLQAPGVSQDSDGDGEVHIRNEHGNVQYRLNGVTVPQGFTGFGPLVDPRVAESIEVITGALPAQYGFRTSGVVNMKTRAQGFDFDGDVGIYGGSNGTLVPSFTLRNSAGRLSYFLSGSYQRNDLGIANPTPDRRAIHDRSEQWRGFGFASYILSPDDRISVFGGSAIGKFQQPNQAGLTPVYVLNGRGTFDSTKLDQNQRQDAWFGVMSYQHAGERVDFQVSPFVRRAKADYTPDPQGGNLLFNGVDTALTQASLALGVQADASFKASDSHTIRAGLFFQQDNSRSTSVNRVFAVDINGNQTSDAAITVPVAEHLTGRNYSAYIQDEWRLLDTLTFNYGVRFDQTKGLVSEHQFSPRAGLVWKPDDATTVHVGYARYFTPPPLILIGKGSVAAFNGTTGAAEILTADPVRSQREHLFDVGAQHLFGNHLTLGIDAYYKLATNLLDDTTLGGTLVLAPFNYARSRNWGIEASASYAHGPVHAYFNVARGEQQAKAIVSSQFLFSASDVSYIQDHYIFTDHSQKWTSSGGGSLNLPNGIGHFQPSIDFVYGSGLRAEDPAGIVPNGGTQQPYVQVNLGIAQVIGSEEHGLTVRFDVINLFDKSYLLHDGSGVGAGQSEYGPRRGFFFGLRKSF